MALQNAILDDFLVDNKNIIIILNLADHGHLEIVNFLVENGADLSARDNYAVEWASGNGHLEIVKFLIEKDTIIDDHTGELAIGAGNLEILKFLNEKGANITSDNNHKII